MRSIKTLALIIGLIVVLATSSFASCPDGTAGPVCASDNWQQMIAHINQGVFDPFKGTGNGATIDLSVTGPYLSGMALSGSLAGKNHDGTDMLSGICQDGVCPVTAFGIGVGGAAVAAGCTVTSTTTLSCPTPFPSIFVVGKNIAIRAAGPLPSALSTPAAPTVNPVHTDYNGSNNTSFKTGCAAQDAIAWGTSGNSYVTLSSPNLYHAGQVITISANNYTLLSGGGASDVWNLDPAGANATLQTSPNATAVTGANCTTTRKTAVVVIDAKGGMIPGPTAVSTASANATNWANFNSDKIATQSAGTAYAFYVGIGAAAPTLAGIELPVESYADTGQSPPFNDWLLGLTSSKAAPALVTFHDIDHNYGFDEVQGTTLPSGVVRDIYFGAVSVISGTGPIIVTVTPAMSVSTGTVNIEGDDGPAANAAIAAACDGGNHCGMVTFPSNVAANGGYRVVTPIVRVNSRFLHLDGKGSTVVMAQPLGQTLIMLDGATSPTIENFVLASDPATISGGVGGSTPGAWLNLDKNTSSVTTSASTIRNVVVDCTAYGIVASSVDTANTDFGLVDHVSSNNGCPAGLFGQTTGFTSLVLDSNNALLWKVTGSSDMVGQNGITLFGSGVEVDGGSIEYPYDTHGIWNGLGFGQPIILNNTRDEHGAQFVYSGTVGNTSGIVNPGLIMHSNQLTDIRMFPNEADVIRTNANYSIVSTGNSFPGVDAYEASGNIFPNGPYWESGQQGGSIESRGNYYGSHGNSFGLCGFRYSSSDDTYGYENAAPVGSPSTLEGWCGNSSSSFGGALGAIVGVAGTTPAGPGTLRAANGVGSLPQALSAFGTCNSTTEGLAGTQTNSTSACSAGTTATSAGTTHCRIYCNGSNWIQVGY